MADMGLILSGIGILVGGVGTINAIFLSSLIGRIKELDAKLDGMVSKIECDKRSEGCRDRIDKDIGRAIKSDQETKRLITKHTHEGLSKGRVILTE